MDEMEEGMGALKAKLGRILTKPKVFFAGLALGGVIVAVLFITIFNNGKAASAKETTPNTLSPSVVFERIASQNEMVSASQKFDIPFTENSFWYRYVGTIKAGVNLETAEIHTNKKKLIITMDEPYVISNTPDMNKSGALEERNNILNPIEVKDVTAFEAQCKERSESEAIKDGKLLEEARVNAEANIRAMFNSAFGDEYTVDFDYRK